jgi:putrescine transport system permease protein
MSDTVLQVKLALNNYLFLIEDELYLSSYKESIKIAGLSTVICLFIGYPVAYGITRVSQTFRIPLLMMIILPFWTSFLIRVFAWIGILNNQGVINLFLMKLGLISEPLPLINNNFAVCVGIVYSYLPFMILPLYATLEKINPQLLEAAYDLGCKPFKAFLTITLPLSIRGVLAGAALVFIPSIGEFVIPELLGGSDSIMIGKILWSEFFINRDWPLASAVAVAMLVLLVLPISLFQKLVAVAEEK